MEICMKNIKYKTFRMLSFYSDLGYTLFSGFVNMMLLIGVGTSFACTRATTLNEEELRYGVGIRKASPRHGLKRDKDRFTEMESREPLGGAQSTSESRPSVSASSSVVRI